MRQLTLREARRLRKLRQEDLAKKAKVDQSAISNYETGHIGRPKPRTLRRLARALDLPPESLTFAKPAAGGQ